MYCMLWPLKKLLIAISGCARNKIKSAFFHNQLRGMGKYCIMCVPE